MRLEGTISHLGVLRCGISNRPMSLVGQNENPNLGTYVSSHRLRTLRAAREIFGARRGACRVEKGATAQRGSIDIVGPRHIGLCVSPAAIGAHDEHRDYANSA
jgi:hypothetical protein